MTRVLSGIQPSGDLHLGNYLGALAQWVEDQHRWDSFFCVVDLHALTVPQRPETLRKNTLESAQMLLAVGLDPEVCTLFVQSHVPQHTELAWLVQCTTSYGELSRMTQFKEKSHASGFVSAGLFTYPTLMAADILLYDAERVPVGEDQRQHLELARDVAQRFNQRYGETFVVPEAAIPRVAARVMDLQHPERKMSKSADSPMGTLLLSDDEETIRKKIRRAVTDSETEVLYDPERKPGVSNLLGILAALSGNDPVELARSFDTYGELKDAVADAVVGRLTPIRKRFFELRDDPERTAKLLAIGASKAAEVASATMERARRAVGLLPKMDN